jgi:hypothetical protein
MTEGLHWLAHFQPHRGHCRIAINRLFFRFLLRKGYTRMPKLNAPNERIKRTYFRHLKEAKRLNVTSVDMAAAAIARFEAYTRHRDLAQFHIEQAIGFKDNLATQLNPKTGPSSSGWRSNPATASASSFRMPTISIFR